MDFFYVNEKCFVSKHYLRRRTERTAELLLLTLLSFTLVSLRFTGFLLLLFSSLARDEREADFFVSVFSSLATLLPLFAVESFS